MRDIKTALNTALKCGRTPAQILLAESDGDGLLELLRMRDTADEHDRGVISAVLDDPVLGELLRVALVQCRVEPQHALRFG